MRRSPALCVVLAVSVLLVSVPQSTWAEPATPIPSGAASTNRRVVSAYPTGSLFPSNPVSFFFGDSIHQPGAACDLLPPELDLHYLTLERTDAGFTASAIFFAPIQPLSELNGKPVTHAVKVTFDPPSGDQVFVRFSLSSGNFIVQRGKTKLDEDEAKGTSIVLLADRLIFSIPSSLGIDPTWAVSARVAITSKDDAQICDGVPVTHLDAFIAPATVGSLTGDDPAGTITFPADAISLNDPSKLPGSGAKMPKGSKIASLRFEHSATGDLIVVATMDADLTDLAEPGAPEGDVTIVLNLASPDFFGLQQPYTVDWRYEPGKEMLPTARVFAPNGYSLKMGDVPVTVDGREVRFDFGGYVPFENATEPEPTLLVPFGDFATSFIAPSTLAQATCLCPPELAPNDGESVAYEDFRYEIIGNMLVITRNSTGSVAYGWIDREGRFLAESEEELYRGVITFIPRGDTYDVGVKGRYLFLLDQQPQQALLSEPGGQVTFSTSPRNSLVSRDHTARPDSRNQRPSFLTRDEPPLLEKLGYWLLLEDLDSTDIEFLQKLIDQLVRDMPSPEDFFDHELKEIHDYIDRHTMPPSPYDANIFSGQLSNRFSSTRMISSSPTLPFPIPVATPPSEFEPKPANADWAIRAESVFLNHEDGVSRSVSGPFVDSHLLTTDTATSASSATIDAPGNSTGAWLTERRQFRDRRRRGDRWRGRRSSATRRRPTPTCDGLGVLR